MKLLASVCAIFYCFFSVLSVSAGEIAITFDDAPREDTAYFSGNERTQRLIHNLAAAGIQSTLFFVLGKNIVPQTQGRLEAYVAAGHFLANHSFDHLSANTVVIEDVRKDIDTAHALLTKQNGFTAYYRPPYLHYGETETKRDQLLSHLKTRGYQLGYVTVDNYDWYMDSIFQKAVASGKIIDHKALGDLYVNLLWESIVFYDQLALKTLGRSPKHVLLLHENDLAALYVGQLQRFLKAKGWKIITPEAAYSDAIAHKVPEVLFHKQGRVAALARAKGVPEPELRSAPESTAYLDEQFSKHHVFIDAPLAH
ncbi:polysaccharide deacetylase family protein [Teredinibacter purpureus]|uniref:polysaccharide deacetylase family protein n=1 Tax=Teredinibacter purpureus TaxID=2731756 RepID=UPI00069773EF|nr:polysaccharide deacetylase family protein [Teredinibacter purpureus]